MILKKFFEMLRGVDNRLGSIFLPECNFSATHFLTNLDKMGVGSAEHFYRTITGIPSAFRRV